MLTVYTISYNEEVMLPHFIKWYRDRFPLCKIIVYDNQSTDNTKEIALKFNCEVIDYDTNNTLDDNKYLEIKNNCWKNANTDWVFVGDVDEHIDITQKQLKSEEMLGNTIITSFGYNMVNLQENLDIENMNYGCYSEDYSKNVIFNKKHIQEIYYNPGCHISNPTGVVKYSLEQYVLYHKRYVNIDYLTKKYEIYSKRFSEDNIKYNWGVQYNQKRKEITEDFEKHRNNCVYIPYFTKHNYHNIDGWFNMEKQYLYLLEKTPEFGIFIELGAWKGKSTSFIVTEMLNRNRKINFTTVDTFKGVIGSSEEKENEAYKQYDLEDIYNTYIKNTKHIKYYNTIVCESDKAASLFYENSVDCLFIDAGHSYTSVKADIEAWLPKMKNGGIMSGHDYGAWEGVKKAVDEKFPILDKVENDCWFIKIIK